MERICNSFRRNPDGSWTCKTAVTFSIPGAGKIGAVSGWTFKPGDLHAGIDVAEWLTRNCARAAGQGEHT